MPIAITFLNQHGLDLSYPLNAEENINGLADIIEKCAASEVTIDQLQDWFEIHKTYIEDQVALYRPKVFSIGILTLFTRI